MAKQQNNRDRRRTAAAVRRPRGQERGPGVAAAPDEAGPAAALIREARLRRDFTQSRIAELSGYGQALISRWERGHTEPSFSAVLKVLGVCGYDLLAALQTITLDGAKGRVAELHLLDEPTPPDVHGFKRLVRAEDAARREAEAERRRPRGG